MKAHRFIADADGDCVTGCGLPAGNARHVTSWPPQAPDRTEARVNATPLASITPATGHAHPETSTVAAASLPGYGTTLRAVLMSVYASGEHGRTDDEMEVETTMSHQTVSAARNRLVAHGWLIARFEEGQRVTRPTRSGRPATVWRTTRGVTTALRDGHTP